MNVMMSRPPSTRPDPEPSPVAKPADRETLGHETLGHDTWDYVSPGLVDPDLRRFFPNMALGDRSLNQWRYLRREIPHSWYSDLRTPVMGFVSLDEATLLHNLALPFAGEPALEIGCWRGWSTAHIASAGVLLDVVDPVLRDEAARGEIGAMIEALGAGGRVDLHPGESPDLVWKVASETGRRWRFIFIDGDHEPPAPELDALTIANLAADDALVVFHDLAAPYVAAGLDRMRDAGWSTRVFQTMQIMGAAWRGDIALPAHVPDARIRWELPEHLAGYEISGEDAAARAARFAAIRDDHHRLVRENRALREAIAAMCAERAVARAIEPLGHAK